MLVGRKSRRYLRRINQQSPGVYRMICGFHANRSTESTRRISRPFVAGFLSLERRLTRCADLIAHYRSSFAKCVNRAARDEIVKKGI